MRDCKPRPGKSEVHPAPPISHHDWNWYCFDSKEEIQKLDMRCVSHVM